ncbi:MAG: SgcJ/EcaC family oxidoreductase [Chloroflexi bacterium]|nr:SgcJ/EcaC family oxidoreductase [Chloroflexota bacterium]
MTERIKNIDVSLVYEVWNEYTASVNAGDLERWMELWVDDGIRMSPSDFGPRQIGKDEIRAVMQPGFDAFKYEIAINPEGVQILGEEAYSHGVFDLTLTPKVEGDTLELKGKFLTILAKQSDGCWKIAIDCFNF